MNPSLGEMRPWRVRLLDSCARECACVAEPSPLVGEMDTARRTYFIRLFVPATSCCGLAFGDAAVHCSATVGCRFTCSLLPTALRARARDGRHVEGEGERESIGWSLVPAHVCEDLDGELVELLRECVLLFTGFCDRVSTTSETAALAISSVSSSSSSGYSISSVIAESKLSTDLGGAPFNGSDLRRRPGWLGARSAEGE